MSLLDPPRIDLLDSNSRVETAWWSLKSPEPKFEIRRLPKTASKSVWDTFAQRCGASFRCGYSALRAWQLERLGRFELCLLEIFWPDSASKIGQCAVARSGTFGTFVDGLHVSSGLEALWMPAMKAILHQLGPGHYRYGSQWSIEPPREKSLRAISGVDLKSVHHLTVQAVDFNRWHSWDHYLSQVATNARRNAKRADRLPSLSFKLNRGLATLTDITASSCLHSQTLQRKKVSSSTIKIFGRSLLRALTMQDYIVTALIRSQGTALASFFGMEFGQHVFYVAGGSRPDNGGAAWRLLLNIMKNEYERTEGKGKFITGTTEVSNQWQNLSRSREQYRVSNYPTSIINFDYQADRMRLASREARGWRGRAREDIHANWM